MDIKHCLSFVIAILLVLIGSHGGRGQSISCADATDINAKFNCAESTQYVKGKTSDGGLYQMDSVLLNHVCRDFNRNNEGLWFQFKATGIDLVVQDILGTEPHILLFRDTVCDVNSQLALCAQSPFTGGFGNLGNNVLRRGDWYSMFVTFTDTSSAVDSFALCLQMSDSFNQYTLVPGSNFCEADIECYDGYVDYSFELTKETMHKYWHGCSSGGTLNNPQWIKLNPFFSTHTYFELHVDSCVNLSSLPAVQWAVYVIPDSVLAFSGDTACGIESLIHALHPWDCYVNMVYKGQSGFFVLEQQPFGSVYAIVIDGYTGAICNGSWTLHDGDVWDFIEYPPDTISYFHQLDLDRICLTHTPIPFSTPIDDFSKRFDWYLNDSLIRTSLAPDVSVTFPDTGSYTLCYEELNYCTFESEACIDIQVIDCTSGTTPVSKPGELKLRSNPAQNTLSFTSNNPLEHYAVYDLFGRMQMSVDKPSKSTTEYQVDVSRLSSGVYLLATTTESGVTESVKFVVQR